MTRLFRSLSVVLLISALAAVAVLLISDALNHLQLTVVHRHAGGLSLMLIGSSYIGLQVSLRRRWNEMLKDIMLGTAFLLWGSEQFLPASPWVTAMDTIVVLIFVVDLGLAIVGRLRQKDHDLMV
jgi:hypothetical protein